MVAQLVLGGGSLCPRPGGGGGPARLWPGGGDGTNFRGWASSAAAEGPRAASRPRRLERRRLPCRLERPE
ncbi:hypothetical protein BS78_05G253500 [Paspalum vaginatum]|nr:hypothetical protein BS78_05G253500 [Paspalum vaginatum]